MAVQMLIGETYAKRARLLDVMEVAQPSALKCNSFVTALASLRMAYENGLRLEFLSVPASLTNA